LLCGKVALSGKAISDVLESLMSRKLLFLVMSAVLVISGSMSNPQH
jgi:hypothetical protein